MAQMKRHALNLSHVAPAPARLKLAIAGIKLLRAADTTRLNEWRHIIKGDSNKLPKQRSMF